MKMIKDDFNMISRPWHSWHYLILYIHFTKNGSNILNIETKARSLLKAAPTESHDEACNSYYFHTSRDPKFQIHTKWYFPMVIAQPFFRMMFDTNNNFENGQNICFVKFEVHSLWLPQQNVYNIVLSIHICVFFLSNWEKPWNLGIFGTTP